MIFILLFLLCQAQNHIPKVHINQTVPNGVEMLYTDLPSHLGSYAREWVTNNPQIFGFPFKSWNGKVECWATACCVPLGWGMLPISYWIEASYIMLNVSWYGPEWVLGFGCSYD